MSFLEPEEMMKEEPEPAAVEEDHDQDEKQLVVRQESQSVMVTLPSEAYSSCDPEPNQNQLLSGSVRENEKELQRGRNQEVSGSNAETRLKPEKKKLFSCETYGEGFPQLRFLAVHLRAHKEGKPFQCETCGKIDR